MPVSYKHQLDTLLTRFNFNFTKSQISKVVKIKAISKNSFIDDVLSIIATNKSLQKKIDELGLLALQLDTRQIEVFSIFDTSVKSSLEFLFKNISITKELLLIDAFPFSIEDKNQLRKLRLDKVYPVLSDKVKLGKDVYERLVVCSVVEKEIEEPIPSAYITNEGKTHLTAEVKYIMKRNIRTQLFHVIYWCSDVSRLILSVDRNVLSLTVSQDQLFFLKKFLMSKGVDSGIAVNVFGAIAPIYNAKDGNITKIGHVTTDGNPVRIPLMGRDKCLKKDHYHQAGENGGHVHAKFAVSKKWEFKIKNTSRVVDVEVGLMGQPKMLDTAQPLTNFSVNKPKRLEDLAFSINKVLSHVPNFTFLSP
jgi:hypothetical protein